MEDEIIPSTEESNPTPPSNSIDDIDTEGSPDRVFDITDDLTIAPAKDLAPEPPIVSVPKPNPQPELQARPAPQVPPSPIPKPIPPVKPPVVSTPIVPKPPVQPKPLNSFVPPIQSPTLNQTKPAQPQKPPSETGNEFYPKDSDLKALRTYEGDVAEVLSHTKASATSIALAEAKKQQGEERIKNNGEPEDESSHAGKKIVFAVISLILIGGGLVAAYYFYARSPLASKPAQNQTQQQQTVSLVPSDSQDVIVTDGLDSNGVLSRIKTEMSKPTSPNSIVEIIPAKTADNQRVRVSAADMLSLMEITPPDVLTRSLDSAWMLGMYTDGQGNKSAFVVVTTNFFQNAFAGMLQWEQVMADDLKRYITTDNAAGIANIPENSDSSSTPAVSNSEPSNNTLEGHFEDRIIMNKDVRAFVTTDGQTLFLYSFLDNTRLAVAANENTLKEILTRLENQAFIR